MVFKSKQFHAHSEHRVYVDWWGHGGTHSTACHGLHLVQPPSPGGKCKSQNSYKGSMRILADTKSNYSLYMLIQLLIFSQEI